MADQSAEPITEPPISAEIAGNRLELIESGAGAAEDARSN